MAIRKGDIVEGEIIDFTHEGNGVLKVDNFTVFAKGGLIGDLVKVKMEQIKKNYGIGSVIEIIQPSQDRIELNFNLTESKGAIPLIELDYSKQLEWKTNKVIRDLEKIGGLKDVRVRDIIKMDHPFRYRNHTQIPVGERDGRIVIGFYEMNSKNIVDMKGTILQPEIGNRIINIIRGWMEEYNISAYNKRTGKGIVRHIGIRTNKDNQAMLILVTGSKNIPYLGELIKALTKEDVVSIYQNINRAKSSITYGRQYIKLYGEDSLLDYIGNLKFKISPNSFFQVNRSQAEVLYNKTIEYLDLNKDDIVYDLYCGIGTISLYIGKEAKKVYGIEIVKEAIEDAKENAKLNGVDNVEFIEGKAESVFPKMMKKGIKANKVVVDPPRKGCEKEVLEAIVGLNPERVVYVSCNPSTMARDVKYLVEKGYKVEEVQPVDMFPHTSHVETVVLMSRVDK
ncbi:MAG: 23S rRNA (uracil(1939)-C(5))-methyltransferase RlmD [Tissierellia bacterium]|nr:23S rRNA (uracil(1939)-C(5))-methyltransferase RlmD [Tissierellia bacterium]